MTQIPRYVGLNPSTMSSLEMVTSNGYNMTVEVTWKDWKGANLEYIIRTIPVKIEIWDEWEHHISYKSKHQRRAWGASLPVTFISECDDCNQLVGGEDKRLWNGLVQKSHCWPEFKLDLLLWKWCLLVCQVNLPVWCSKWPLSILTFPLTWDKTHLTMSR